MSASAKGLVKFLDSLSQVDKERWTTLTPARRRSAEARFQLFCDWGEDKLSAEEAINRFGKSSSRFYRLAARWRDDPSLEALGVGIRAPRSRVKLDPRVVNDLQAKVPAIVRLYADASVRRQAALLLKAAGYFGQKPIGTTALRKIVEAERRRIEATGRIGYQIALDCSAINLPQPGGRPFILYLILDAGTGLVMGFSVGDEVDITAGYAAAAADALEWVDQLSAHLPWSTKLSQTILVSGREGDASEDLVEQLTRKKLGGNVLRASGPRRFGSQFRKIYGERLGRISITPARTLKGEAVPDNGNMTPWRIDEARHELKRTFSEYNAMAMGNLYGLEDPTSPASLLDLLQHLSGMECQRDFRP